MAIPELSFQLGGNGQSFVNVSITGLNLVRGLNYLNLTATFTFNDSTRYILKDILNGINDRNFTLNGPIAIKGSSFLETITEPLILGKFFILLILVINAYL